MPLDCIMYHNPAESKLACLVGVVNGGYILTITATSKSKGYALRSSSRSLRTPTRALAVWKLFGCLTCFMAP